MCASWWSKSWSCCSWRLFLRKRSLEHFILNRIFHPRGIFSYLHGTVKLCNSVHWINKDSVWKPCAVHVNSKHFDKHPRLRIRSVCTRAALCLLYCVNIRSAGTAEGLISWWQTINSSLFRMSSAESIPFSAWWPSPSGAKRSDWLVPTELVSAPGSLKQSHTARLRTYSIFTSGLQVGISSCSIKRFRKALSSRLGFLTGA